MTEEKQNLDEKLAILASVHPLLAVKERLRIEEENRSGQEYVVQYLKIYASGNSEWYDTNIKANNAEEAIKYAKDKLAVIDALASWSTNITEAYLFYEEHKLKILR